MSAELLGVLTLALVPLNLVAVVLLAIKSYARPDLRLLRKDLITAFVILVHITVYGIIFANNDRIPPWLDTATTKLITRWFEVALGLVCVIFLWLYLRPRRG